MNKNWSWTLSASGIEKRLGEDNIPSAIGQCNGFSQLQCLVQLRLQDPEIMTVSVLSLSQLSRTVKGLRFYRTYNPKTLPQFHGCCHSLLGQRQMTLLFATIAVTRQHFIEPVPEALIPTGQCKDGHMIHSVVMENNPQFREHKSFPTISKKTYYFYHAKLQLCKDPLKDIPEQSRLVPMLVLWAPVGTTEQRFLKIRELK